MENRVTAPAPSRSHAGDLSADEPLAVSSRVEGSGTDRSRGYVLLERYGDPARNEIRDRTEPNRTERD
jgi:hypothetical protein